MLRPILFLVLYCTWQVLLDQCCQRKIVNGKQYQLRETKEEVITKYGCVDNCVYEDSENNLFCFASGQFDAQCAAPETMLSSTGLPTTTCNSNECCYYNQEWFKIGENVTEIISKDESAIIYVHCDKNNQEVPKIMMDTTNNCLNAEETASPSCKCGVKSTARIVGGTETEVNAYPWMALLANSFDSFFCGGTLIASQWVLTAGHCMFKGLDGTKQHTADDLKVVLGEHDIASSSESLIPRKVVTVSKIITHPSFSLTTNNNDIALLKLSEEVDITTYTPSCIASASDNFEGEKALVYGWGLTASGKVLDVQVPFVSNAELTSSDKLLEVEVPVVSNAVCQAAMDVNITDAMLCAGGELDKDSCQGDSGGPLTVSVSGQHTLIGCVSFGKGCGVAGKYGVYGDVAYFRSWVDYTVSNNGGAKYCEGEAPVCPAWTGSVEPACPSPPPPPPIIDPPLLFVGPGLNYDWNLNSINTGNSEIFNLPPIGQEEYADITLPTTDCYIPPYPHTEIFDSLGFNLDGILTVCGGYTGDGVNINSCFSLTNFNWTASTPMLSARTTAAAVLLPNHTVMISGGSDGNAGKINTFADISQIKNVNALKTTELFDGEVWTQGPELPYEVGAHCMVYYSGNVIIIGGYNSIPISDTYAFNIVTGTWTKKASMNFPRWLHACSVLDDEIWVGGTFFGNADTEIYNLGSNQWRQGPQLPYYTNWPGEFVSHGKLLFYMGGYEKTMIHQLNKEKDGWIFIRDMAETRFGFPALVITESACYGVTYSEDVGAVGGAMLDVLNSLTDTSLELEVSCCRNGELSVHTCGNKDNASYVPCNNICGKTNEISAILDIDTDDSTICDNRYPSIPIYRLWYCVGRVTTLQALDRNKVCCLHPYVYRRPGVRGRCCKSYGWCV